MAYSPTLFVDGQVIQWAKMDGSSTSFKEEFGKIRDWMNDIAVTDIAAAKLTRFNLIKSETYGFPTTGTRAATQGVYGRSYAVSQPVIHDIGANYMSEISTRCTAVLVGTERDAISVKDVPIGGEVVLPHLSATINLPYKASIEVNVAFEYINAQNHRGTNTYGHLANDTVLDIGGTGQNDWPMKTYADSAATNVLPVWSWIGSPYQATGSALAAAPVHYVNETVDVGVWPSSGEQENVALPAYESPYPHGCIYPITARNDVAGGVVDLDNRWVGSHAGYFQIKYRKRSTGAAAAVETELAICGSARLAYPQRVQQAGTTTHGFVSFTPICNQPTNNTVLETGGAVKELDPGIYEVFVVWNRGWAETCAPSSLGQIWVTAQNMVIEVMDREWEDWEDA